MVLLLFLIGERLEGWAANRARQGVSALMALEFDTAVGARWPAGNRGPKGFTAR
jgi:Cd2+/Zn2+-exporting ATPase